MDGEEGGGRRKTEIFGSKHPSELHALGHHFAISHLEPPHPPTHPPSLPPYNSDALQTAAVCVCQRCLGTAFLLLVKVIHNVEKLTVHDFLQLLVIAFTFQKKTHTEVKVKSNFLFRRQKGRIKPPHQLWQPQWLSRFRRRLSPPSWSTNRRSWRRFGPGRGLNKGESKWPSGRTQNTDNSPEKSWTAKERMQAATKICTFSSNNHSQHKFI